MLKGQHNQGLILLGKVICIGGSKSWVNIRIKTSAFWGFPGGAVVKKLPASAGDTGSIPGLERSHMPQSN